MANADLKLKRKQETNEQFISRIINYSPTGALAQMFIIEAISRYAKAVAAAPPIENAMIDGGAWKRCAAHIDAEMKLHLGQ